MKSGIYVMREKFFLVIKMDEHLQCFSPDFIVNIGLYPGCTTM